MPHNPDRHQVEQFVRFVINPVCDYLGEYRYWLGSRAARRLLLGTALHESGGLRYMYQVPRGPAVSLFQIEPNTVRAIDRWFADSPFGAGLQGYVMTFKERGWSVMDQLPANQRLACAYARSLYASITSPLPHEDDIAGLAAYYKSHYNSPRGKATPEDFIAAYEAAGGPAVV